jgi:hypothetical protein
MGLVRNLLVVVWGVAVDKSKSELDVSKDINYIIIKWCIQIYLDLDGSENTDFDYTIECDSIVNQITLNRIFVER